MPEAQERRAVSRTPLAERPAARVRGLRDVHLLDLSLAGAQIEHVGVFRFGASCALDLPPPCGALSLPAQVVWCAVIGRTRTRSGESHLVARSGPHFTALTEAPRAALADSLQHLAAPRQPIGDNRPPVA